MKTIDVHTHGIGGYDTHADSTSSILKIAEIHGNSGVSEIILSIYPSELNKMRREMEIIKDAIEMQKKELDLQSSISGYKDSRPAIILGVHLEGPFLNESRCGSLDREVFLEPDEYAFKKLIEGFEDIVRVITIAPELNGATALIRKISDMGIIVNMGHSEATYNEAEQGFNCGAKGITHIFNAMRGFHHREPGIAGFALTNRNIYIEVISDPYHLHPVVLQMIFGLKKPERIIIISDSVKETGLSNLGVPLTDPSGKLLGGSITIIESANWLIEQGYDKEMILRCITENPYRYLTK